MTTLLDAGSYGTDGIEKIVWIAKRAPNRVRILINLSRLGVAAGELLDFANVDVAAVRRAIEAHPSVIMQGKRVTRPGASSLISTVWQARRLRWLGPVKGGVRNARRTKTNLLGTQMSIVKRTVG